MRPLILATTSTESEGLRTEHALLGTPYLLAIENPGGTTILVTPAHEAGSRERLLDLAQGLVLTGGEDVAPSRYGEEPRAELGEINLARDEMEFSLLLSALERRMPVLAICRGMQLLNVALGGTLYQDLPSQLRGDLLHEQQAPVNDRWHRASVERGSRLEEIFGSTDLHINSFHHQGVKELAPALRARVWAEDGLIEGVEAPEFPWVIGVQWHPERGEAEVRNDRRDPDRRIFWAFVQACREYAR